MCPALGGHSASLLLSYLTRLQCPSLLMSFHSSHEEHVSQPFPVTALDVPITSLANVQVCGGAVLKKPCEKYRIQLRYNERTDTLF